MIERLHSEVGEGGELIEMYKFVLKFHSVNAAMLLPGIVVSQNSGLCIKMWNWPFWAEIRIFL